MYDSDLSDEEWELIEHHFQPTDKRGAASVHPKRTIVNAIRYLNKTGAQWRMLPKDFPPWQTVYDHYSKWNRNRVWEAALDELNALHRKKTLKRQHPVMGSSTRRALKRLAPVKNVALMVARRLKGANAISWSIHWAILSMSYSMRPISMTPKQPARYSAQPMSNAPLLRPSPAMRVIVVQR